MYAVINDREEGSGMHDNEKTPPIDSATGMYTTIYFQDFTAMIDQNPDDIPVEAESDGNKYFHFVYRMLLACESGSCGGDACRLYEILRAGLDGALQYSNTSSQLTFEHLLGWTAAASAHGLYQLFYRGEPTLTQYVFELAANEWKKLFEFTETSGVLPGVSDELRYFAFEICTDLQKLVKRQKKEHGEHAKYSFNFIKPKSRPPKKPVEKKPVEKKSKKVAEKKQEATKEKKRDNDVPQHCYFGKDIINCGRMQSAAAAAECAILKTTKSKLSTDDVISDGLTSRGGPVEGERFYDFDTVVKITVKKRYQSSKLGLGLTEVKGPAECTSMKVTTISESSLFHNTGLRTGMIIFAVNDTVYTKSDHCVKMLQNAKKEVVIFAAFPRQDGSSGSTGGVDDATTHAEASNATPGASMDSDAASDAMLGELKVTVSTESEDSPMNGEGASADVAGDDLKSTDSVPKYIDHGCNLSKSETDGTAMGGMKRKSID